MFSGGSLGTAMLSSDINRGARVVSVRDMPQDRTLGAIINHLTEVFIWIEPATDKLSGEQYFTALLLDYRAELSYLSESGGSRNAKLRILDIMDMKLDDIDRALQNHYDEKPHMIRKLRARVAKIAAFHTEIRSVLNSARYTP